VEFRDASTLADYARSSIVKCVKAGLVTGRSGKLFAPKDNITRAETSVIIKNFAAASLDLTIKYH
jgi:endo-1,4-beta-xylanase